MVSTSKSLVSLLRAVTNVSRLVVFFFCLGPFIPMTLLHRPQPILYPGLLREPNTDDRYLVLWLPEQRNGGFQYWLRVGTLPRAALTTSQGLCTLPATALPTRQRIRGVLGKLLGRFWSTPAEGSWLLPNGDSAEPCGERQTDLLLVWPEEDSQPLEESRLRSCWPQCQRLKQLGPQLWLLWSIAPSPAEKEVPPAPPPESCLQQAEQRLAAMRQAGDRPGEATALTDLGIAATNRGDVPQALAHLEQALALARALGDPARESDVLGNLALAALAAGQLERAQQCLEQELAYTRAAGDRFAEKLALDRLGTVHAARGHLPVCMALLQEALALTRILGDRQHEADLLWHLAIRHAEGGQRDQTLAQAQAAVEVLERLGKPEARIYAEHLQKYRRGETGGVWLAPAEMPRPGRPAGLRTGHG